MGQGAAFTYRPDEFVRWFISDIRAAERHPGDAGKWAVLDALAGLAEACLTAGVPRSGVSAILGVTMSLDLEHLREIEQFVTEHPAAQEPMSMFYQARSRWAASN